GLSHGGLKVRTTATNLGSDACPYGSGAHPYLTLGTETINRLELRAPARTVLQSDERGLPLGAQAVKGTEYDFRKQADRFNSARPCVHRPRAGPRWPCSRRAPRSGQQNSTLALGRPELLLPDALHRRPACQRTSSQPCR